MSFNTSHINFILLITSNLPTAQLTLEKMVNIVKAAISSYVNQISFTDQFSLNKAFSQHNNFSKID